MFNNLK